MEKEIISDRPLSMAAVWRFLPKTDSQDVKSITRAAAIHRSILPLRLTFSPTSRAGPLIPLLNLIRSARAACRNFSG
jgi:hypothetical protein